MRPVRGQHAPRPHIAELLHPSRHQALGVESQQCADNALPIISAPLTLRDQVIAPLLAGVADPRIRRTPRHWTDIDRHYQALRLEMMALFAGIGIPCG